MGVNAGRFWRTVAEILLNQSQVDTGFEQVRGPGVTTMLLKT